MKKSNPSRKSPSKRRPAVEKTASEDVVEEVIEVIETLASSLSAADTTAEKVAKTKIKKEAAQGIDLFYTPAILVLICTAIWYFKNDWIVGPRKFFWDSAHVVLYDWAKPFYKFLRECSTTKDVLNAVIPTTRQCVNAFNFSYAYIWPLWFLEIRNYRNYLALKQLFLQWIPYIIAFTNYWSRLNSNNFTTNTVVIMSVFVDCYLYDVYILENLFDVSLCNCTSVQLAFLSFHMFGVYFISRFLQAKFLRNSKMYLPSNIYVVIIACLTYLSSAGFKLPYNTYYFVLVLFVKEWIVSSYFGGFLKHAHEWFVNLIYFNIAAFLAGLVTVFLGNVLGMQGYWF